MLEAAAVPNDDAARDWTVVIPVKPAAFGKSRLHVPDRESIARAIALDTIAAAAASDRVAEVIVVTADAQTAYGLRSLARVRVVHDTASGLRAAIEQGLDAAGAHTRRAVLLGDLPALRGAELSEALTRADRVPHAFVPDAEGSGTTLATVLEGLPLPVLFGAGSGDAHRAAGFVTIDLPVASGLRRDLDVVDHLPAVLAAAPGSRTAALITLAVPAVAVPAVAVPAPVSETDAVPARLTA